MDYKPVEGPSAPILNSKFTNTFRKGYLKALGCVLPLYFKQFGERIKDMEVREDDIWVCSFPKTGTTWTQEMIWCLANDLDMKGAEQPLPLRFPFLDHSPLFDYADALKKYPDMNPPDFVLDSVGFINKHKSPRLIKTHLPFHLLPKDITSPFGIKPKIIYVYRNPRDTCVSYFHHCQLMEGYKGNFEEFARLFMDDALCFAPYPEHLKSYWDQKGDPRLLILKYEDMKKDLETVVRKSASFLGKTYEDKQIYDLCDHLSFESMKKNRAVNYEPVIEMNHKYNLNDAKGSFMRQGKVGAWKDGTNVELETRFDDWVEKRFSGKYWRYSII